MFNKLLSLYLVCFMILCTSILPVQAGYAPLAPSITIAGRVFTDLSNLIMLACNIGGNNSCTFRALKGGASSGYQVTAGKTLKLSAFILDNRSNSNVLGCEPVYADNDIGLNAVVGSFTNPVYYGGFSNAVQAMAQSGGAPSGKGHTEYNLYFEVPAAKYPGINCPISWGGSDTIMAYGYEE